MDTSLLKRIEKERKKLSDLWNEKGSVLHPEVLICSEKLDKLILRFLIKEKNFSKEN
ncbi:MAG: aspartyl-phosphate phosphatase Spo0E family protein [Bacillota bacterium]